MDQPPPRNGAEVPAIATRMTRCQRPPTRAPLGPLEYQPVNGAIRNR